MVLLQEFLHISIIYGDIVVRFPQNSTVWHGAAQQCRKVSQVMSAGMLTMCRTRGIICSNFSGISAAASSPGTKSRSTALKQTIIWLMAFYIFLHQSTIFYHILPCCTYSAYIIIYIYIYILKQYNNI